MSCGPSGVTQDKTIPMYIAKNLGKRETLPYDGKSYLNSHWTYQIAFNVLRYHPKFETDTNLNRSQSRTNMILNEYDDDEDNANQDDLSSP